MVELRSNSLVFTAAAVHPSASLTIHFQRTLRIPDDDKAYPLPPGLGNFPLKHVDDFAANVPSPWLTRGGVMLPMYQSEAMWISFGAGYVNNQGTYPFAVKIAAGKINAVTGESWSNGLRASPQDYIVVPEQPWLDGFCVSKGLIRQFVAMPLGAGYSAEEQITGQAEHGGVQIVVYPMKREVFERRFPRTYRGAIRETMDCLAASPVLSVCDMGLSPGGKMRQEIYDDPFDFDDWDHAHASRCFVHLCNSMTWRQITGSNPPQPPITSREYSNAGLPWFDYYTDAPALPGSEVLSNLKSVSGIAAAKGDVLPPGAETMEISRIIQLRAKRPPNEVREGVF